MNLENFEFFLNKLPDESTQRIIDKFIKINVQKGNLSINEFKRYDRIRKQLNKDKAFLANYTGIVCEILEKIRIRKDKNGR